MAVRINGLEDGPIKFTDNKAGRSIFVGPNAPTNPTDGDVWIDSDLLNNAGKNLISTTPIVGAYVDLSVSSDYKDLYVVFRGVQTSTNATVTLLLNDSTTSYVTGSSLFEITSYKTSVSTNHFAVEIPDTQDTNSFAWGTLKGIYTNASNTNVILNAINGFTSAAAITKLTIKTSTGSFSGGTALVYGVN
jgi:hypothetical protein